MTENPIIIDLTYLYSITGGDKAFEQMLLAGTVVDLDATIADLKDAWEKSDAAGIRRNAHLLVSLSAIGGMPQVESWSREIDRTFADGIFHPETGALADNIISGWPAAKLQLEKIVAAG